ncbi:MAG: two pore domain potassium channel family protein [Sinobacterium sp.]|nr:two pore domain potassium channel family protein [Sinobacterium sp.]
MAFTLEFVKIFAYSAFLISPILASLSLVIIILGQIAAKIEGWKRGDALYWTFITATTVGYGDMRPTHHSSRLLSVFIAITGVIFTGMLVSIAIEATSHTFKIFANPDIIETIRSQLEPKQIVQK